MAPDFRMIRIAALVGCYAFVAPTPARGQQASISVRARVVSTQTSLVALQTVRGLIANAQHGLPSRRTARLATVTYAELERGPARRVRVSVNFLTN